LENHLSKGNAAWPVKVVHPEIEDLWMLGDTKGAESKLLETLSQDYDSTTKQEDIDKRPWFGRCVWESDNDVCDDQVVTITWDDDYGKEDEESNRSAKTALFHMAAFTERQCERRGRIYGTRGEIEYDSRVIRVYDFATQNVQVYRPHQTGGHHGGGDLGLATQFLKAVSDVKNKTRSAREAQALHIGCSLEDIIRSHAMVFAAEEARLDQKVVQWEQWWKQNVSSKVH
jgi:hypothetical protein